MCALSAAEEASRGSAEKDHTPRGRAAAERNFARANVISHNCATLIIFCVFLTKPPASLKKQRGKCSPGNFVPNYRCYTVENGFCLSEIVAVLETAPIGNLVSTAVPIRQPEFESRR